MTRHYPKERKHHNVWQIQEAKAKFSQLIQETTKHGRQIITKNGEPVAVILSKNEFDKLKGPAKSLIEFFKDAPFQETELEIQRAKDDPREIDL
jgi:prevent-host-death family protein